MRILAILARRKLESPKEHTMTTHFPRVGIGHDTHRLVPGNGLRLGGVLVPYDFSLLGHSDADVLLHAVTDALLGAAALGDIGEMFPDTAAENRGRSSAEMLRQAYALVKDAGWAVGNLDCIVFAQRPKLKDYKPAIAAKIAEILAIAPQQVGVKAKTGEGVGPVGECVVIEAQCVALLIPSHITAGSPPHTLTASRPIPVEVAEIETPHIASASLTESIPPVMRKR